MKYMQALQGYKTYLVAALTVLYAVSGFLTGHIDANSAVQLMSAGLGMAAIRHAITTTT